MIPEIALAIGLVIGGGRHYLAFLSATQRRAYDAGLFQLIQEARRAWITYPQSTLQERG